MKKTSKRTNKGCIEISDEDYKRLKYEFEHNKSPLIRCKCHVIILRAIWPSKGDEHIFTISEIKSALFIYKDLNLTESKIHKWISEYRTSSFEKFIEEKCKPCKEGLDNIREQLCQDFNKVIFQTVDQIIGHIRQKYGIAVDTTQMLDFLHNYGFSSAKTISIPDDSKPKLVRRWVRI